MFIFSTTEEAVVVMVVDVVFVVGKVGVVDSTRAFKVVFKFLDFQITIAELYVLLFIFVLC